MGMAMWIHSGDVVTWRVWRRVVEAVVRMGWRVEIQTTVRVPSGHNRIYLRRRLFLLFLPDLRGAVAPVDPRRLLCCARCYNLLSTGPAEGRRE